MNYPKPSPIRSSTQVISIGFIIITLLIMFFAFTLLRENEKHTELDKKMHQHSITFSISVLNANIDILSMQRYMKDVVLATNESELEVAIFEVEQHEQSVYQYFKLIKERYLGDEETINIAYQSFVDWEPIRNEVIDLKRNQQNQLAAASTTGKGAAHIKLLSQNMDALIEFARNKALEFKQVSQSSFDVNKPYIYYLLILIILTAIITTYFVIFLVRKTESSLRKSEENYTALFNNSEVSIWSEDLSLVIIALEDLRKKGVINLEEYLYANIDTAWNFAAMIKINHVNNATLKLFGATSQAEFISQIGHAFGTNAIEVFIAELCAIWDEQESFVSEANFLTIDGKEITALISFQIPSLINNFHNVPINIVDISDQKKNEQKVKLANTQLAFQIKEKDALAGELVHANKVKGKQADELVLAASVFTHAREDIIIADVAGTIINVNDTFTTTTGYSREEAIGKNPRMLQSGRQSPEFYAGMWQAILEKGHWYGELWNRRKNGEIYAEMKTISAVRDENGTTTHYVSLGNDITPMKQHQDQLERIVHYDILTNLPNRSLLADRLSQAMLQCNRRQQSLAVVFLDLDGFKKVNDTHGHVVGDELLIALSHRMTDALREGDTLARFGGDEYVAILVDLAKVEDCEPVLERLLLAVSEPVIVGDVVIKVTASIGVTLYPQDSVDADQLIRHADQAMYVAKESGKNRYHLFDITQDDAVNAQRKNLEAIRRALDEQQFVLNYQPKVNMRTGAVTGVEALIRWQHPQQGLLNPIDFLPVIENHAMSIEMGEWVIDTVLTQISLWQKMGLNLPVSTSVNIAAIQLQHSDFTEVLTTQLAAHPDVEPHYLELEVRETSAVGDVQQVSKIMEDCMALGVKFALDDFGTGYSSLTYLRCLPASLIKIDKSFVLNMLEDSDDFAIVEGIIALAKSFKRDVIAEGVETIAHGTALLQMGCELAQGYGIAKPMPASDVPAWVSNWKSDAAWRI